jgi:hypothetical protein
MRPLLIALLLTGCSTMTAPDGRTIICRTLGDADRVEGFPEYSLAPRCPR